MQRSTVPGAIAPGAVAPGATVPGAAVPGAATQPNPAGRIITFAVLGFGLFNVLSSIPGFLDLSSTLNQSLEMLGLDGEFSNFSAARTWGVIAVIVLVAGYAGTAWLALKRLKRNRSAWWIPIVGAVVTFILISLCISVPMFGDPAFTQGLLTPPAR